jgi:sortase A
MCDLGARQGGRAPVAAARAFGRLGVPPGRTGVAVRTALRAMGQLLTTLGVVILLFGVYSLYGTGLQTARAQSELRDDLRQSWATPPQPSGEPPATPASVPPPALGEGVAVLRIPRLGQRYEPVVVEGVGREELKKGPGHYPGSAMPGEVGNYVLAGHRTTYGAPFGRYGRRVGAWRPGRRRTSRSDLQLPHHRPRDRRAR